MARQGSYLVLSPSKIELMIWDVIISGSGIIGINLALELRRRGAQVLVLDSGEPGQEASSAAAGMLAPDDPDTPEKLRLLCRESARMYPAFVQELESISGIKVDFRHGAISLLHPPVEPADSRLLSFSELKQLEPALDSCGYPAYLVSENSVDPALLMQAALQAARAAGIEIRSHVTVKQMSSRRNCVEVITTKGRYEARTAVNCQGAWSGAPVRPRKGQMIYLQPEIPGLLRHVVRAPEVYLVPRSSGKILAGATVEDVGYDKAVVPEVIQELHRAAAQIVPQLAATPMVASWAGLRPGTPDDLPILGNAEAEGIFIASGHFRNGILLAPLTARIIADLIAGKKPALDISTFSPSRFANVGSRI